MTFDDCFVLENHPEEVFNKLNRLRSASMIQVKEAWKFGHAGALRREIVCADLPLEGAHEQSIVQREVLSTVRTDVEKNVLEVNGNGQVVEIVGRVLNSEVDREGTELLMAEFVLVHVCKV